MKAFTVFMPVHNTDAYLNEAIESVLKQDYEDFDFLIIDDGSTDKSKEIIMSYSDPRIKFISAPHDYIATLNMGLEVASGEYIAHFDSDDIMPSNRLSIQLDFIRSHPDIDVCGGYIEMFGNINEIITWYPLTHREITNFFLWGSPVVHGTSCIKKEFIVRNNLRYSDDYIYCEDYKLWVDIAKAGGKFANIPETLLQYRCHRAQVSTQHHSEQKNGSLIVRQEAIEWFVSNIEKNSSLGMEVVEKFLPSWNFLNMHNMLTPETYVRTIYEIVDKLRDRKIINV
ncbi:glycosyltransferase family 2 protein [Bacteroides acidifaciens]|jgi:Glycosyltransferases, probably involved in cell wall biogenesis|uniref:glycosyltransferase family 2 protein n=1 Tax=Bacteroides acidifaciens TaxID=85831 RepID=UPI00241ED4C9|nr:glycosyltransferase [Bacteroides acidifaciens]